MTNYEAMRTMAQHALAKFLSSIMDGQKCPASEKFCDGQRECDDAILNWLNAESDDTELKRRLKDDPHHDVLATARLAKLAAENPALPIVAMVNFEVVAGDEFSYWIGEINNVDVKELCLSKCDDARTWDREEAEDDYEEFIERYASNEDLMKIESLTDEKLYKQAAMEWIAGLPWAKCIVIFVEAPDKLTRKSTK